VNNLGNGRSVLAVKIVMVPITRAAPPMSKEIEQRLPVTLFA
jgi:hypothetical protein